MPTTVHLIFNAHIDPVWLWPWQSGLDEAIATCRSACDRLDAHPELIFTRGEAWVYAQIEEVDPELFARLKGFVDSGRWEIVNGWWLQPDCNGPSGWGMERQIELGRDYFQSRFGRFPRVGYNVDSFGHAATLPALMRRYGQDRYVMMRPGESEMTLPARVFRWRGYEGDEPIAVFRIAWAYTVRDLSLPFVESSLTDLPEGIEHTMCFAGVGDHGGGPTEKQIAWCRENKHVIPGTELQFSSVERFFDAIAGDHDKLPLVTGELQQHAIGCYTAYRPIHDAVRRAEHTLRQAECLLSQHPDSVSDLAGRSRSVAEAWKAVCFSQFHDILGGTCIESAYPPLLDQVGGAAAVGATLLQSGLRRLYPSLGRDGRQRIAALNASDNDFDGYIEFEPWIDHAGWGEGWRLVDVGGEAVPVQIMHPEALAFGDRQTVDYQRIGQPRIVFPARLAAGALTTFAIEKRGEPTAFSGGASVEGATLRSDGGVAWEGSSVVGESGVSIAPRLELIDDPSDTWSHGLKSYSEEPIGVAEWDAPKVLDHGPLMVSALQNGRIGDSRLRAEWRAYAGVPAIELLLTVHWLERLRLLKLSFGLPKSVADRTDGILGGRLRRENDGRELPLRDWTHFSGASGEIGVVCPDVYSLDATPERVRLTLLRSPIMAHHEPNPGTYARSAVSDQGVHSFRFRFYVGESVSREVLEREGTSWQRPLVLGDLTNGMPTHVRDGS